VIDYEVPGRVLNGERAGGGLATERISDA